MDYKKIASEILQKVGGAENVEELTHCFTRLRFVLKDTGSANTEEVKRVEGVISVIESGGQYQVVLGNKVDKVFAELEGLLSVSGNSIQANTEKNSMKLGNRILMMVAAIFTPTIPAIAASGMLKGILAVASMLALYFGNIDIKPTNSYIILSATSDAVFYFMPIILAYSAAKVFKVNEFLAMIIGGTLCYPAIVSLMTGETRVDLFGIPVTKASYTSSVIPIIIAVWILSYVQRFFERYIPQVLQIIMVPTMSLLVMIPATLLVFGPIGIYLGNAVNWLYYYIHNVSPILLGAFIGGAWCILVIFGAHRPLLPIGINDVANNGRQNLLAFAGSANFSQAGAAFGVFLRTKNKELKTVAASATVTALFGITEPAIYGTNLRLKRPMVYAVLCGAAGGAVMGWGGTFGDAFANQGVLTIPVYMAGGTKAFVCYLAGCLIAFGGSALLTCLLGFQDLEEETEETGKPQKNEAADFLEKENKEEVKKIWTILSPVEGSVIPLAEVRDEVFSSGLLGAGAAVVPKKGEVVAPEDCTVAVIYPTLHAIGFQLDNGVELLVHIGVNTVELNGTYFTKHVEEGCRVKRGEKIISFDIDAIEKAGYCLDVPVIVTNSDAYVGVTAVCQEDIKAGEAFLHVEAEK